MRTTLCILLVATLAQLSAVPQSEGARVRTKKPKISTVGNSPAQGRLSRRQARNTARKNAKLPKNLADVIASAVSKGKGKSGYRIAIDRYSVLRSSKGDSRFFAKLKPGQWVNAGSGKDVSYRVGVSKKGKALTEHRFTDVREVKSPSQENPQFQRNPLFGVLLHEHRVRADGSVFVSGYAWKPHGNLALNNRKTTEARASSGIKTRTTRIRMSGNGKKVTAARMYFTGVIPAGKSSFSLGSFAGRQLDVQMGPSGMAAMRVVTAD